MPTYLTCLLPATPSSFVAIFTVDDCLSDHCLITADIAVHTQKPIVTESSQNISSVDVMSFENDLRKSVLFAQHVGSQRRPVERRPRGTTGQSRTSSESVSPFTEVDQQVALVRSHRREAFLSSH